jgi:hypothetical protein
MHAVRSMPDKPFDPQGLAQYVVQLWHGGSQAKRPSPWRMQLNIDDGEDKEDRAAAH